MLTGTFLKNFEFIKESLKRSNCPDANRCPGSLGPSEIYVNIIIYNNIAPSNPNLYPRDYQQAAGLFLF